jgi:hypothetical protein
MSKLGRIRALVSAKVGRQGYLESVYAELINDYFDRHGIAAERTTRGAIKSIYRQLLLERDDASL